MTKILIEIDTDTQVVVPRVPTSKMLAAAYNAVESEGVVTTTWMRETIYRAMMAAAPQPEQAQQSDINIDAFALELMQKVWAIGNRFGPDCERKAQIQEAIADAISGLLQQPAPRPVPTTHADDLAVDRFAKVMKAKLAKKRGEGRGGWETCPPEILSNMLVDHIAKGDPVDVANFCMMLHQNGDRIVEQPRPVPTGECRRCGGTGEVCTGTIDGVPELFDCPACSTVPCAVVVPAHLSHTGEDRSCHKPVDACIAKYVDALNAGGLLTANSCCGHGVHDGEIVMNDGVVISIRKPLARHPIPTSERLPTAEDADPFGMVAWWNSFDNFWVLTNWGSKPARPIFTHWRHTGLTMPPAPGDE